MTTRSRSHLALESELEIIGGFLAAVADDFIFDRLALVEGAAACTFDRGDMDEYVLASGRGLNESVALRRIEPFHGARRHLGLLVCAKLIATARASCHRISEVSVVFGKSAQVRNKARPS